MSCNDEQIDALKEIINIGVGQGANVLNEMLGLHIQLSVPNISILTPQQFSQTMASYYQDPLACIALPFKGNCRGNAQLVFPCETASRLISALVQDECLHSDMDSIRAAAFTEVGNIVLNAVMGTISNMLGFHLEYSMPDYTLTQVNDLLPREIRTEDTSILLAKTRFSVEALEVIGNIILFVEVASFDELIKAITQSSTAI